VLKQEIITSQTDQRISKSSVLRLDWVLTLLLGLAFAVRLLVWLIIPHQGFVIDEQEYYDIGSVLASGRGWSFYDTATWVRPPLYVLYLAGIFQTIGANLDAVRLGQILMSVGAIYLLYRTTLLNYGRRTALWTVGLAALAWPFVVFPYLILTETLFLLLFTASIYCVTAYLHACQKESLGGQFWPRTTRHWFWLAGAGLTLGLAGLTRGQVLSFLPFVAIWLGWALARRWKQALAAFVIILGAFLLTVAPWAYHNYSAYGRPVLETTGGYNFYLGSLGGRNGHKVSEDLIKVKNQADRESLGYQLGLQKAVSDPLAFINKGLKESLDFWQINYGADERIEKGFTKGEVSPLWLIPDFIFNDVFYILLAALGLLGLVIAPSNGRGLRSFVVIWTLQNMALAFLFFAVSRFRVSVYFFLLPFAAYVIANRREIFASLKRFVLKGLARAKSNSSASIEGRATSRQPFFYLKFLTVVPALAFLIVVLPPYLLDFSTSTPLGIRAWLDQENARKGDSLRLAGDYNGALAAYKQAQANNPATIIGIGLTYAAQGQYNQAIALIGSVSQDIAPTHLALGYIWHLAGNDDYARREFESRPVSLDGNGADSWAWAQLPASNCPSSELKMGAFDWGCVDNFHFFQNDKDSGQTVTYRWTDGRGDDGRGLARLRFGKVLTDKQPQPKTISLRLKGFRPTSLTAPKVEVWVNGRLLNTVQTGSDWQTFVLNLPPDLPRGDGTLTVGLGAATFVPDATDRRELGVMVEWVRLQS